MAIKGVVYNQENPYYIQDLKIRGGIGGEVVNGGAILQLGEDCALAINQCLFIQSVVYKYSITLYCV